MPPQSSPSPRNAQPQPPSGWPQGGITSHIAAEVVESAFDDLDAPIERVTGGKNGVCASRGRSRVACAKADCFPSYTPADVPMPYARNLELAALPNADDVAAAARRVCHRSA
eukprot:scaffold1004_cov269-Pinguiococcus_pyrenoidosus.AAC.22